MNWWRTGKRPQDHLPEPAAHGPESEAVAQKENPVLALQRAAGNRAVQKILSSAEGKPIAEDERPKLESAFGQDLREVRVHLDEDAAELAANAGANAFTVGRDIYFAAGAYGPATLAHEVGHVMQQAHADSFLPAENASLEHQADSAASAVVSGHAAVLPVAAAVPAMQRQAAPGAHPSVHLLPSDSLTVDGFEIDRCALSGEQSKKLDAFVIRLQSTLTSAPDTFVTIVGFADAPGTETHNLTIGQKRAETVRDYLVNKGIPANQLHASSLGESSPSVPSKGYEAKNRRVEIDVMARTFFKPSSVLTPPAPVQAPPAPAPRPIDLKYHPKAQTPGEELEERLRQADRAVREAQEEEKAHAGMSVADLAGRVLRKAAKKLGMPKWIQDEAESLGKDLPTKGAQAVVDQIGDNSNLDANTRNALKALVDALAHVKLK
ncbi:DUF4157 domain-containing protein [Tunturibacter psychrotolerans]|uniref:DUF4157 domain-containing protein n=1 Tax=Tunturiibacter psychrotolerans TaxID=3069686 RepID=A0AAU7ZRR7_9BACT